MHNFKNIDIYGRTPSKRVKTCYPILLFLYHIMLWLLTWRVGPFISKLARLLIRVVGSGKESWTQTHYSFTIGAMIYHHSTLARNKINLRTLISRRLISPGDRSPEIDLPKLGMLSWSGDPFHHTTLARSQINLRRLISRRLISQSWTC